MVEENPIDKNTGILRGHLHRFPALACLARHLQVMDAIPAAINATCHKALRRQRRMAIYNAFLLSM